MLIAADARVQLLPPAGYEMTASASSDALFSSCTGGMRAGQTGEAHPTPLAPGAGNQLPTRRQMPCGKDAGEKCCADTIMHGGPSDGGPPRM